MVVFPVTIALRPVDRKPHAETEKTAAPKLGRDEAAAERSGPGKGQIETLQSNVTFGVSARDHGLNRQVATSKSRNLLVRKQKRFLPSKEAKGKDGDAREEVGAAATFNTRDPRGGG